MKRFSLGTYALSGGVAVALLAGCGGSQPAIGAPGAMPQTSILATHADHGVQALGSSVAVGDFDTPVVYRFTISGSSGTKTSSTSLGSGAEFVGQFLIRGKRMIAPNECVYPCLGQVLYYPWPAGGNATTTITDGIRFPESVVLSEAKK